MLTFVPIPIGNQRDITLRALDTLKESTIIFCENKANIIKLCRMYEIPLNKTFLQITSHTSDHIIASYVSTLKSTDCCMVSDAGTPGLSDPGKLLVKLCRENNIPFDVLPGPTALIPAVVGAYTDTSSFSFFGFLPHKKGRKTLLQKIISLDHPSVLYESVHRVGKLLKELKELEYTGKVGIRRELSKMFEQKEWGSLEEISQKFTKEIPAKGEFVIILAPHG